MNSADTLIQKKDIRQLSLSELQDFLLQHKEKAFRAKQIVEWLWKKSAHSFSEMTNLSLALRNLLSEHFDIFDLKLQQENISADGTIKYGFALKDDHLIESVLIPTSKRMTVCISSQVGCSLTCKFCATGYMPRKRNLDASEIYDQVVAVNKSALMHYDQELTNIVYMGMGEPLLNYQNVLKSIEYICSTEGLNWSYKRLTLSTAGIAKMIYKLADDEIKVNLALSLHAANDVKRNEIMPINESNRLEELMKALSYFYQKTRNKITYEYIVFKDFNDGLEDAGELYQLTKYFPVKINLIEYNPIEEANYTNTSQEKMERFIQYLEYRGVVVNWRRSRGKDIDAACGQLAIKEHKKSVSIL